MGLYDDIPSIGASPAASAAPPLSPLYHDIPARKKGLYDDIPGRVSAAAKKVTDPPDSWMRHGAKVAIDNTQRAAGMVDAVLGVPQRFVAGAATAFQQGHPERALAEAGDSVMHPGGANDKYQEGLRKAIHTEDLKYHGNNPQWYNRLQNFGVDVGSQIVTDPLTVTPVGWVGKGARVLGAGVKALPGVERGLEAVARAPGVQQLRNFVSATGGVERDIGKDRGRQLNTLDTRSKNYADALVGKQSRDRPGGGSLRAEVIKHKPELDAHYAATQAGTDAPLPAPVRAVLDRLNWIQGDREARREMLKEGYVPHADDAKLPVFGEVKRRKDYVPKQSVSKGEEGFSAAMASPLGVRQARPSQPGYVLAQHVGDESAPTYDRIMDYLDQAERSIAVNHRNYNARAMLGENHGEIAGRLRLADMALERASDPERRAALQAERDAIAAEHADALARQQKALTKEGRASLIAEPIGKHGQLFNGPLSEADAFGRALDYHGLRDAQFPPPSAGTDLQSGAYGLTMHSKPSDLKPLRRSVRAAEGAEVRARFEAGRLAKIAERTRGLAGSPMAEFAPKTEEELRQGWREYSQGVRERLEADLNAKSEAIARAANPEVRAQVTKERDAIAAQLGRLNNSQAGEDSHVAAALARQARAGTTVPPVQGKLSAQVQREVGRVVPNIVRAADQLRPLNAEQVGLNRVGTTLDAANKNIDAAHNAFMDVHAAADAKLAGQREALAGTRADLAAARDASTTLPFNEKQAIADVRKQMHAAAMEVHRPYWDALKETGGKIAPELAFNPKTKKWERAGEFIGIPKSLMEPWAASMERANQAARSGDSVAHGNMDEIMDYVRSRDPSVKEADVYGFFRNNRRPPLVRDFTQAAQERVRAELRTNQQAAQGAAKSVGKLGRTAYDQTLGVERGTGALAGAEAVGAKTTPPLVQAQKKVAAAKAINEAAAETIGAIRGKAVNAIGGAADATAAAAGKAASRVDTTLQREAARQEGMTETAQRRATQAELTTRREQDAFERAAARNKALHAVKETTKELLELANKATRSGMVDRQLYRDPETRGEIMLLTGLSRVLKDIMFLNPFPHIKNITVLAAEAPNGTKIVSDGLKWYAKAETPEWKALQQEVYRIGGGAAFFHEREAFLENLAKKLGPLGFAPKLIDRVGKASHDQLWKYDMSMRISMMQDLRRLHPEWSETQIGTEINRALVDYAHKSIFTHTLEAIGAPFPHWRTTNVSRQAALLTQNPAAMERVVRAEEGINQDLLPDDLKKKFNVELNTPIDEFGKASNPASLPGYAATTTGPVMKEALQYMTGKRNIQTFANEGVEGLARRLVSLVPFGSDIDDVMENTFNSKAPKPLQVLMKAFGAYAKSPESQRVLLKRAAMERGAREGQADAYATRMIQKMHHYLYPAARY